MTHVPEEKEYPERPECDFSPPKGLDERFRAAEQYAFDFDEPPKSQPPKTYVPVCINNCQVCADCDGD